MTRRPPDFRGSDASHGGPQERLEQARKAKADLLARKRAVVQKAPVVAKADIAPTPEPTPLRNRPAHLQALRSVPLWRLGDTQQMNVSKAYLDLADVALQAMEAKDRHAVLCWPECMPSPSALSVLLAVADCAAAPGMQVDGIEGRAPPAGLRALIYPHARTAHRGIRQIYADKSYLGQLNTLHQLRANRPSEDEALADFHKVLARAKKLTGLALDGQTYDEFRHPCLDELVPFGPCQGDDGRLGLLWRVRPKTDLKHISRTGSADDPTKAKFYVFGLRAKDQVVPSLKALNRNLDVIFLDVTASGRARLGRDWVSVIRQFLEHVDTRLGPVATVALTDDPWSYDALRFDALLRGPIKKVKSPAKADVIFAAVPDIVEPPGGGHQPVYSVVRKQELTGYSGEIEGLLKELRKSARKAEEFGDREATDLLRQIAGTIRRCTSLPASREALSAFLHETIGGGLAAADIEAGYRISSPLRLLREATGPWCQRSRQERDALLKSVERVWENTAEITPMAPMLRDVVHRFHSKSSATAVFFAKDMLADLAEHALCGDAEIGDAVRARLDKEMLLFLDRNGLDDIAALPGRRRNYIKTLIVVAPSRSQLMKLLAREWLPENLIVLGDSDTLALAADDAKRLGRLAELAPIAARMTGFAAAAANLIHRIKALPELSENLDEADFPSSSVINLAGNPKSYRAAIRFRLAGEQIILARPSTKLIVQDRNRTLPVFQEAEAKDVEQGDRVCVVGDAFLEMARPMLNIAVRAAEEIRDYHELVLERFDLLPGATRAEKLAALVMAMGLQDVSVQRALYWVDLEAQLLADLHEVIPHAPRDRTTFLAFMKALGVTDAKSHHYWTWAVIAQRSSRLRAAISFHDAYRTILVDNYAAQSGDPKRASEIRRLKQAAEDFVVEVVDKGSIGGEHEAA